MSVPMPTSDEEIRFIKEFVIPSFDTELCNDQTSKARKQWMKGRQASKEWPVDQLFDELIIIYGSFTREEAMERWKQLHQQNTQASASQSALAPNAPTRHSAPTMNMEYSVEPMTVDENRLTDLLYTPLSCPIPTGQLFHIIQISGTDTSSDDLTLTTMIRQWLCSIVGTGEGGLHSRNDGFCGIYSYLAKLDTYTRDTHEDSTVSKSRSDRTDFKHGVPIVNCEEKDVSINEAVEDLVRKFNWLPHYSRLPFVFGVAMTRSNIEILVFRADKSATKIFQAALHNPEDKWKCVIASVNIARILLSFEKLIARSNLCFNTFHKRNHKRIRLSTKYCQIKIDGAAAEYHRMKSLYQKMSKNRIPYIESIFLENPFTDTSKSIRLVPVGVSRKPSSQEELITAIRQIGTCLSKLHEFGLVHCDVRWSNIIEFNNDWILIDCEYACELTEEELLKNRSSTINFRYVMNSSQPWDTSFDFFQIGMLLQELPDHLIIPKNLSVIRDKIIEKNFEYDKIKELLLSL